RREAAAEGGADDWGEVVTRYPYRKVGMDHLLSTEHRRRAGAWRKRTQDLKPEPAGPIRSSVLRECPSKPHLENWIRERVRLPESAEEKRVRAHGGCLGARSR